MPKPEGTDKEEVEKDKGVPFHESIVEALTPPVYGSDTLITLGRLIIATKIPQHHDKMLEVYEAAVNNITDELLATASDVRTKLIAERDQTKIAEESGDTCKGEEGSPIADINSPTS